MIPETASDSWHVFPGRARVLRPGAVDGDVCDRSKPSCGRPPTAPPQGYHLGSLYEELVRRDRRARRGVVDVPFEVDRYQLARPDDETSREVPRPSVASSWTSDEGAQTRRKSDAAGTASRPAEIPVARGGDE